MDETRRFIEDAITQDLFGADALSEPAELEVPEKYTLRECLGRGGFGVVYRAHDAALERDVALKFLTHASPADVERFRREARFTARLSNPAIVQVYELGEAGGQPYIAMQYVDGANLGDARLESGALVTALRDVAIALDHAHREGVVHRDLKPANILVDREQRAYLTDFGIARDLRGVDGGMHTDGWIVGTPALMPPEQARGDSGAIDARADIYALGATLFLLLCGRYPFQGDSTVDILHAVIHERPPLPRSLDPTIPRALEALILRCMQKQREARYASMAQVADDLTRHLAGQPVENESAQWFRRLVGAPTAPPATPETDLFEVVGAELVREIADWDAHLYRVSRNLPRLFTRLDEIIQRLESIRDQHPRLAWPRFYRGVALMRRGRLVEALDDMERTIDRLADRASAQFELGRLYLKLYLEEQRQAFRHVARSGRTSQLASARGRLQQAVVAFDEMQRMGSGLLGWQRDYARAVGRLGDEDFAGCVEICDEILADDPDVEDVWKLRGDALRFSGGDPRSSYEEAVQVRRSDHETLLALADYQIAEGELEPARETLTRVLKIYPEHPEALAGLGRVALESARATDGEAGLAVIGEGLEQLDRAADVGRESYEVAVTTAELWIEHGKRQGQRASLDRALAVLEGAHALSGCMNRVKLLEATAWLERARIAQREGADPRPDLDAILVLEGEPFIGHADDCPWPDMLAAARALLRS